MYYQSTEIFYNSKISMMVSVEITTKNYDLCAKKEHVKSWNNRRPYYMRRFVKHERDGNNMVS